VSYPTELWGESKREKAKKTGLIKTRGQTAGKGLAVVGGVTKKIQEKQTAKFKGERGSLTGQKRSDAKTG